MTILRRLFARMFHPFLKPAGMAPLSQRILVLVLARSATSLGGVLVFGVGRELYPLQLLAIDEGAGVGAVALLAAFGGELHADGLYLLLEVEVLEVLHSLGVEHVAEVTQAFDVDALALAHAGVHHAGDVAQHGLHVRVAHCGDFRQVMGDGLRFYGFTLHDGLREVNLCSLTE